jgi:predicted transcriptional regulator
MARTIAQQKQELANQVMALTKGKDIRAVAEFIQNIQRPAYTLSPEDEEELRLGLEDIKAGRVSTWEEAKARILLTIKEGGEISYQGHGKNIESH